VLATFVTGYAVGVAQVVLLAAPVLVPPAWLLTRGPGRVVAVGTAVLLLGAAVGGAWWGSLLPGRIGHDHRDPGAGPTVSVADLRGPASAPGEAVHHFTLTARHADVALPDGRTVAAWTFGGRVPGPALVVTQGELVEVELRNADIAEGVTLH
jgi:FtsP/CotA-like multicopper oxidase with cupredoxin domain